MFRQLCLAHCLSKLLVHWPGLPNIGTKLTYDCGPNSPADVWSMSNPIPNNVERINLRLRRSAKQLLERAASFEGQSVSKFVLSAALAQAEKTIQAHEVMRLNAKDSETFLNALAAPVNFNRQLMMALTEHDQRITSK